MKIKKLLPLVLVAPLLASCGGGVEVKEPEFKAYATIVDREAMYGKVKEEFNALANNKEEPINSFEMKKVTGHVSDAKLAQHNDIVAEEKGREESTTIYDKAAATINKKAKTAGVSKVEVPAINYKTYYETNYESEDDTKIEGTGENAYRLAIDHKTQTINKQQAADVTIDDLAKSQWDFDFEVPDAIEWEAYSQKRKDAYKFYADGRVYTIEIEITDDPMEDKEWDEAKQEYVVVHTVTMTHKIKKQIDFSTYEYKMSQTETRTEKYVKAHTYSFGQQSLSVTAAAEEEFVQTYHNYNELKYEFKDVHVESRDLSGYYVYENKLR